MYDLYECKLAIVSCAGHEDDALVDSLWQSIITKGVPVCMYVCCMYCIHVYVSCAL